MWIRIVNLFRSSTFRLALFFALAVTAATSLVLIFVYWQMTKLDIAHQNRVLVDDVAKVVDQPQSQLTQELHLRLTQSLHQLDYAALFDPDGRLISGNVTTLPPDLPVDGAAHALTLLSQSGVGGEVEPALVVAARRKDGGVLLLGRSLYEIYSFQQVALQALVLGLAPTIVLALIIGTIFSRRAARRFRSIDQKITRIMQGNLHERLPTDDKNDDLDRVARAVNLMLDEIVRLLGQIQSVGDNIAHDLRTPLAVMRARLEHGLKSALPDELEDAVQKALDDLDHAMATVTALLRISDIEYGHRKDYFVDMDFREVCVNVFELYQPLAEAKSISLTLDAPEALPISGDFDLLVEAVANLVDNAIKFTPAHGLVQIMAKRVAGTPTVRVVDSGPGVAPFERTSIFKRFYRSKSSKYVPGTGLGLSMAATIAELHGFDLHVAEHHPGAMFEMALRRAA